MQVEELTKTLGNLLKLEWIYDSSNSKKGNVTQSESSPNKNDSTPTEIIPPSEEIVRQLYHFAMMGDIPAIEGILEEIKTQDKQLLTFANELGKLTTSFQTAKIRKFIKQFLVKESAKK